MNTESPPGSSRRTESDRAAGNASGKPADGGSFGDAAVRIREIGEYVSYYVATKADAAKLAIRSAILYGALGIVALLGAGTVVVVAVVLMLVGLAKAIGAALGGMEWLGDLIVGVGVLVVIGAGAMIAVKRMTGSSRKQTVDKYESRKRRQRHEFGQDIRQRAGGANE